MATLMTYAYMAAASYGGDLSEVIAKFNDDPNHGNWKIADYQAGSPANGFQGAIFESANEVVCAYKGSKGGIFDKTTTGYDDWCVNDVQIAMNKVPSQVPAATSFLNTAKVIAKSQNKTVSVVGHSLGGGLAQFVGYYELVPFVTFNAPGMKRNLTWRLHGEARLHVKGFNMILVSDPVGNFGKHIGKTERFMTDGLLNPFGGAASFAHVMKSVISTLKKGKNAQWATRSLDELIKTNRIFG